MQNQKVHKKSFLDTRVGAFLMNNKALVILLLLCVVVSCISDVFLTPSNLLNVIRQVAYSVTLACGFTLVLSSGNMDLSIGCEVGLVGICMGKMLVAGVPLPLTLLASLVLGAIFSSVNALVINSFDLPPFIVTLATMSTFKGATYIATKMVPVSNLPQQFVNIGQGYTFGIPNQVYICLLYTSFSSLFALSFFARRAQKAAAGRSAAAAFVFSPRPPASVQGGPWMRGPCGSAKRSMPPPHLSGASSGCKGVCPPSGPRSCAERRPQALFPHLPFTAAAPFQAKDLSLIHISCSCFCSMFCRAFCPSIRPGRPAPAGIWRSTPPPAL